MTLGERIKILRKNKNMTLRDLSQKVDISISFLSDIENDRSKPSLERLGDIAKALDTTVSYLLGEDIYYVKEPSAPYTAKEKPEVTPVEMTTLPILGEIHAGRPLFADEHVKEYMPFPKKMLSLGYEHFLLEVEGDSMTGDGIEPGDIVLVRVQNYIDYNGQIAAIIINGEEACLKHVHYPEKSNMAILRSSNPKYEDIVYPIDDLIINGVYAGLFKSPKK